MLIPPIVDLPPTGTNRMDHHLQYVGSQTIREEEFIFNTKDYLILGNQYRNAAVDEYFRNIQRRFDQLMVNLRSNLESKAPSFYNFTSKKELQKWAGFASVFLLTTNPQKISVDITPDATVFFTAVYAGANAYVEIHSSVEEDTELIFNIYENNTPVLAYGGPVELALNKFLQHFLVKSK